jgi:flagellar basal-body rod protein FlgB
MAIADIPIFSMLRTKMQWHQERQRLLAENVSNADTPKFQPKDLAEPNFSLSTPGAPTQVALARTEAAHIAGSSGGGSNFALKSGQNFQVRPAGNAVSLEDEMMKVANNQMDFQAASALYSRSLGLIKMAVGRG